ncbi:FAD-binding and (Fe-S)-binding domain-containing protein [Varibaculum vaginae]|uniref:FAD-binding and (Fe-S)-binding domain-containing protein n=1 Tax=Varibaculum vaginae TaxID=2364797 RepID=UPI000F07E1D8|nr:FAD-binding and (Fe-S)-binding domain-containing protein [Varibaculum vaginae]
MAIGAGDYRTFRSRLREKFRGELLDSRADRAVYATDSSNYRIPPKIIACPKDRDDLRILLQAARECRVPVTARGAGTSCAGNSIGPGLVIDYSRHLNQIIKIDPEKRYAIVEPGVVQAQLQQAVAPYGLRFGPDPSTSSRCTIGGMVGNNACGPHATAYGRTSDNVLELRLIDGIGREIIAGQTPKDSAEITQDESVAAEQIQQIPGLKSLVAANLATIRTEFGRFGRQVSGYSLEHLLPENGSALAPFFSGTEGTLGVITQVTVRLVPLPEAPVLVALGFPDMIAAAAAVPRILPLKPLAVEGMDARLVEVVRQHKGPGAVPDLPQGSGWLLCEVGGEGLDEEATLQRARELAAASGASGDAVMIYPPGDDAAAIWRIRADGAGLGGRTPQGDQAWPGWEDAAVPPENLAAYLRDFQKLLEQFGLDGLLYGHFGDGCVHVRLNMPLGSAAGLGKSRDFLFAAAQLVGNYGGSISGEHGDGRARSELLPKMYSAEAVDLFAQVKALFDPDNLMNPGVLTGPAGPDRVEENVRRAQVCTLNAQPNGFAFSEDTGSLTDAFHRCTGVGKCRADNSSAGGFMCPSFLATGREQDATRGRARILQEATNGGLIRDLSDPEIWRVLDLCLACKACSADCPAGVDMAKWRSETLFRRYRGRLRPLSHYALGWLPRWLRVMAKLPGSAQLANLATQIRPLTQAMLKLLHLDTARTLPRFATRSLEKQYPNRLLWPKESEILSWGQGYCVKPGLMSTKEAVGKREKQSSQVAHAALKSVVIWADSFSRGLDQRGVKAAIKLLADAGWQVFLAPPDTCCGLTWITTGQLKGARQHLEKLLARLAPPAANGIPIVGIEPSCTAVLRDDLLELFPSDPRALMVSESTFTLAEFINANCSDLPLPDLSGVSVVAQPHCHHYSVMGWEADRALLEKTGAKLVELQGCCGMAGNFGMEAAHRQMSLAVAERALLPALKDNPEAIFLADGFSCRTQAETLAGRQGVHLAELLAGADIPA